MLFHSSITIDNHLLDKQINYQIGRIFIETNDWLSKRSINSWSKLTSAITSIDRNVINTAFVLLAFRQASHQWIIETFEKVNLTVTVITIFNSLSASSIISIRNTRNSSIESSAFSDDWFINRTIYRTAIKAFHSIIAQYHLSSQYKNYLLKSKVNEKQPNLSNISSFIDGTSSQPKSTAPRSKIKYFIDIDDNSISDRNSKEFISTIHNINDSESQLRSASQQVIKTSAEKTIYENLINLNIMFTNFNIQIAIDVAISAEMKRVLTRMQKMFNDVIKQRKQQKSPKSSKSSDESRSDDIEVDDSTFKWNSVELNFYDFNYDDKILNNDDASMKHAEKNIYFRNVHLFVIRVKKTAMTKDSQLVKNNLWTCLKNTALKWYINELSDINRRMLRMTMNDENDLIEWITRLIDRFKEFNNITLQNLLIQRYIIRDVVNHRESRKYAQKIIRAAKNAGINLQNQLNLIYNDIDVNVRADIMRRSRKRMILNELLIEFDEFKFDWWIKARKL